jgi:hypothetical protein
MTADVPPVMPLERACEPALLCTVVRAGDLVLYEGEPSVVLWWTSSRTDWEG